MRSMAIPSLSHHTASSGGVTWGKRTQVRPPRDVDLFFPSHRPSIFASWGLARRELHNRTACGGLGELRGGGPQLAEVPDRDEFAETRRTGKVKRCRGFAG